LIYLRDCKGTDGQQGIKYTDVPSLVNTKTSLSVYFFLKTSKTFLTNWTIPNCSNFCRTKYVINKHTHSHKLTAYALASNDELFSTYKYTCIYMEFVVFHSSNYNTVYLTFRHRASSIEGQAFHYSSEKAFYIFNQQIYILLSDICLTVHRWYK